METETKPNQHLNVELFEKIKAYLREEPRRFDMSDWISHFDLEDIDERYRESYPPCGTTLCVAGTAVFLNRLAKGMIGKDLFNPSNYHDEARDLLGITEEQATSLFYTDSWPKQFYAEYAEAASDMRDGEISVFEMKRRKVEAGCKRIDHLIATGE